MAQGWSSAKVLPENTRPRCQISVNGAQPAGVKVQLMGSVVLFLLIRVVCERERERDRERERVGEGVFSVWING